jgi:hypothetical protein
VLALHGWLKVLDAIGGLAAISERLLAPREDGAGKREKPPASRDGVATDPSSGDPLANLGELETRLAGVLVAALKEAFDRDRARLDLERHHLDAERDRAERAMRLERRRLAGERALSELRLLAILGVSVWLVSATLMAWRGGEPEALATFLMAGGWASLIVGVACAFVGHARVQDSLASSDPDVEVVPRPGQAVAAIWLLPIGLALTSASLLTGL